MIKHIKRLLGILVDIILGAVSLPSDLEYPLYPGNCIPHGLVIAFANSV